MENYDFSGWATRANLKCSDGLTIMKDAFKHNDGKVVPLVWNHQHDNPNEVLGHALLENREEGVYAYCKFNDTESGNTAKLLVQHGDVNALSIYANQLKKQNNFVEHGNIREVSLVLAGANPGAWIDSVIKHGEESDDEAVIYTDETINLSHGGCGGKSDEKKKEKSIEHSKETEETPAETTKSETTKPESEETVADVLNTLNEKQKTAVYAIISKALEYDGEDDNDEEIKGGNETMKQNVFDKDNTQNSLSHADMEAIFKDAKRCGSLKEAFLAHSDELAHAMSTSTETSSGDQTYGIIGADDWLFPEARLLNNPPEFIKRKTEWVSTVMNGVHHSPFSRIKSMFADITEDDARARGYIKGKMKKEEFFTLLKRTTTPTTIYKKQKMDRDDIVDITDFDVVAWLKSEMRMMLDEEIARAILVGDGRLSSSDDKINELNIRPIWKDEDLYTIKATVNVAENADADTKSKAIIRSIIKSRKDYRGSGTITMFTTDDVLTDMLLMEDSMGRVIYDSVDKLKSVLRVSNIVTVPVMEGLTSDNGDLAAILVDLRDYNVGADKGGAVNMFDDFDIDYNQQKYLIETRCSGALIKPYSAIAVEVKAAAAG